EPPAGGGGGPHRQGGLGVPDEHARDPGVSPLTGAAPREVPMHRKPALLLLAAGALLLSGTPAAGADPEVVAADEQALEDAKVGTDGPALLDFFRKNTLSQIDEPRVRAWIRQLGDRSFRVRDRASAALVGEGRRVAFLLQGALKDPDA